MRAFLLFVLLGLTVQGALAQSGPGEFVFRYQGNVVPSQSFSFDPVSPGEDCSSELRGTVFFDDATSQFCFCNGSVWCIIGGGCGSATSCLPPTGVVVPDVVE